MLEKWNDTISVEEVNIVIPIPKKRKLGPECNTEDFRGISVQSVMYKVMCLILQERI